LIFQTFRLLEFLAQLNKTPFTTFVAPIFAQLPPEPTTVADAAGASRPYINNTATTHLSQNLECLITQTVKQQKKQSTEYNEGQINHPLPLLVKEGLRMGVSNN
jgi:hypothetical protein